MSKHHGRDVKDDDLLVTKSLSMTHRFHRQHCNQQHHHDTTSTTCLNLPVLVSQDGVDPLGRRGLGIEKSLVGSRGGKRSCQPIGHR